MSETDDGPVVIGSQKPERVAGLEPLGLKGVVHEYLPGGVGDRSAAGHDRAELSVQIDAEGEDVVSQCLAVLVLDRRDLSDGSRAHESRRRGSVLLCQVLGSTQLLVTQP